MKSSNEFYRCQVCSAPANHSNYGALSCPPCKMFFRRNAQTPPRQFQCDFDGHCEVNINNRHMCPSCRLEKCFLSGMQIELIRGSRFRCNSKRRKKNIDSSKQYPTLNLLETSSTTLTIDQYNLFSQVIFSYDEQRAVSLTERYLSSQNILPIKLRFKSNSVEKFLQTLFNQTQRIFIDNPHQHQFSSNDRLTLLHHQMPYLILFSSSLIINQSHLFNHPAFQKTIENLFGKFLFLHNDLFTLDIPVVKFSLAMICFTSFDYTMDTSHSLMDMSSIGRIEHLYADIIWRYLTSTYSNEKAVKYFIGLIETFLALIDQVVVQLADRTIFFDMVKIVINQTEQSLKNNF